MLVKTLLKIAEHLEMDLDKLSVKSIEHSTGQTDFYLDDKTGLYSIEIYENLNDKNLQLYGTITNLIKNTKMDLLASLLEWGII